MIGISRWTGSIHFSTLVRTSANRRKFANKIMAAVEKYNLNGVNLDWGNYMHTIPDGLGPHAIMLEYPNDSNGISCNRK